MDRIRTETSIKIDLYGGTRRYLVTAKQGDKASRFLRVQLMEAGNDFEIPDGVYLIANIKKPDGKFCYNECQREGNVVIVELTNQALAAAGTAYCDIEIRAKSGEKILSSALFEIEITPSARDENAIESSNEMSFLDRRVQEYIDKMLVTRQQILDTEAAFKVAEAARALAEADRITQEGIRVENEKRRVAAEQTRQQQLVRMQNATEAAKTAAGDANNAAERAERLYKSEEALAKTLEKQREILRQMQELKQGVAYNVDGGSPDSIDQLICDGGTPFTREEICIDCGTP